MTDKPFPEDEPGAQERFERGIKNALATPQKPHKQQKDEPPKTHNSEQLCYGYANERRGRTVKITIVATICLWAICGVAVAQSVPASPLTTLPEPFDHYRQATVSIGQERVDGGKKVFATAGSGVVITDGRAACLLTAKHMFFDPERGWLPTQVVLRLPPDSGQPKQDARIQVELVREGVNLWTSPPDGADLAVLPLRPDLFGRVGHPIHAIQTSDFGSPDEVYQGADILVLGYPAILGEDFLSTPLARGGIVSWDDPVNPGTKPFLVDANLYPGNSGGPVFHMRSGFQRGGGFSIGGGPALVGIVSKGAVENAQVFAGGVPITATNPATGSANPAQAAVLGIGGIGIIEPISRASTIISRCLSQQH